MAGTILIGTAGTIHGGDTTRVGDIRIGITRHTGEAEIIRAGILLHNDPAIYGPITEAVLLVYGRTTGRERVPGQM